MNVVRLVALRHEPLEVAEVLAALDDPSCGGVDLFIGRVRDHDRAAGGTSPTSPTSLTRLDVTGLEYEAHPSALAALQSVAAEVAAAHAVGAVAVVHRVGSLRVGDIAVIVGTAAAHRAEAFEATRALIDTLKTQVPIWKNQRFADGSHQWVGLP